MDKKVHLIAYGCITSSVCTLCIFCHFSYASRENDLVKDNLLVLLVKYPDEDTTILKREVTTNSNCMLWNCIGIFITAIHTYYIIITSVPITYYNCVLIIVIGAIHRYYESHRKGFQ